MLAMSDTKRRIRDVNELIIVPALDLWDIKPIDSNIALGTYNTLERAQEVLMDYTKAYRENFILKNCSSSLSEEELKKYSNSIIYIFPEK